MVWAPIIASVLGSLFTAGASIINTKRQNDTTLALAEQEEANRKQLEMNNNLRTQQLEDFKKQDFINQHVSNLNKGTSTGLLANQMPAGTGIGVQGLNSTGYLNEDSVMAKVGGLFSKKGNTKNNVRDNNNLYFDRIEYAKCGGRFKRK